VLLSAGHRVCVCVCMNRASLDAHLAEFDHPLPLSGALSAAAAGCMLLSACQHHAAPLLLLLSSAADTPAGRPCLALSCLLQGGKSVC
jgi:hypothetical protein